jgi:transcriptional adapter 2-alpha
MSSPLKKKPKKEDEEGEKKGGRYHCDYCTTDISNEVRVKCANCPDFDLCVDCFSVGVEIGVHKSNHDYRVIDDMSKPLYTQTW